MSALLLILSWLYFILVVFYIAFILYFISWFYPVVLYLWLSHTGGIQEAAGQPSVGYALRWVPAVRRGLDSMAL